MKSRVLEAHIMLVCLENKKNGMIKNMNKEHDKVSERSQVGVQILF